MSEGGCAAFPAPPIVVALLLCCTSVQPASRQSSGFYFFHVKHFMFFRFLLVAAPCPLLSRRLKWQTTA